MGWPLSQDYNEAVQNPRTSFSDPELRDGEAATNALGIPAPRSGNFADVYEFRCPATQGRWAVKCFTRAVPGLRERYAQISQHLRQAKLPFTVDFDYLDQGLRVRGQWYPVVKMQWVEGLLLNEFVRDALDKPALLETLGQIWVRMAKRLREAGVAHCDLQHGNVLLVPGSKATSLAVKLVDYDGMFVPALAGSTSGEVGHPAFQHPQRLREGTYNLEVDRFPLLVVATALRCLQVGGRKLWERYDNGDNLLFREADLRTPGESALFKELWRLNDPVARALVGQLALASQGPLEQTPFVGDLLADGATPSLLTSQEQQIAQLLGIGPALAHLAGERPDLRPEADTGPVLAPSTAPPPLPATSDTYGLGPQLPRVFERLAIDSPAPLVQPRGLRRSGRRLLWAGVVGGLVAASLGIGLLVWAAKDRFVGKRAQTAVAQQEPKEDKKEPTKTKKETETRKENRPPEAEIPTDLELAPPGWIGEGRRFEGHGGEVRRVAMSPDGRRVLSACWDGIVRLFDVQTGRELKQLRGHTDQVHGVAFCPDGRRAVSCGKDKTVRLWDLGKGEEIYRLEGHQNDVHHVAVSPDGRRAASGAPADDAVFIWDLEKGLVVPHKSRP